MTSRRSATAKRARTEASMDLVFVIDEMAGLLPGRDTSVALMEAAQLRVHRVLVATAAELDSLTARPPRVAVQPRCDRPSRTTAGGRDPEWFTLGEDVAEQEPVVERGQRVIVRCPPTPGERAPRGSPPGTFRGPRDGSAGAPRAGSGRRSAQGRPAEPRSRTRSAPRR